MPIAQGNVTVEGSAKAEVRLSLIVSPELNATLERLAERAHATKSDILRKAIALFDVAAEAKENDQRLAILDRDGKVVKEIVGI
jgi:predicted transcriptional regulator